jgi:hypothetical protein
LGSADMIFLIGGTSSSRPCIVLLSGSVPHRLDRVNRPVSSGH